MPQSLKNQVAEARADLDALIEDLPKLEQVLRERESDITVAKGQGATLEQIAELHSKRNAVASMVEQHRQDIREQQQLVQQLEQQYARENLRARATAGTKRAAALRQQMTTLQTQLEEEISTRLNQWMDLKQEYYQVYNDTLNSTRSHVTALNGRDYTAPEVNQMLRDVARDAEVSPINAHEGFMNWPVSLTVERILRDIEIERGQ